MKRLLTGQPASPPHDLLTAVRASQATNRLDRGSHAESFRMRCRLSVPEPPPAELVGLAWFFADGTVSRKRWSMEEIVAGLEANDVVVADGERGTGAYVFFERPASANVVPTLLCLAVHCIDEMPRIKFSLGGPLPELPACFTRLFEVAGLPARVELLEKGWTLVGVGGAEVRVNHTHGELRLMPRDVSVPTNGTWRELVDKMRAIEAAMQPCPWKSFNWTMGSPVPLGSSLPREALIDRGRPFYEAFRASRFAVTRWDLRVTAMVHGWPGVEAVCRWAGPKHVHPTALGQARLPDGTRPSVRMLSSVAGHRIEVRTRSDLSAEVISRAVGVPLEDTRRTGGMRSDGEVGSGAAR